MEWLLYLCYGGLCFGLGLIVNQDHIKKLEKQLIKNRLNQIAGMEV